MIDSGRDEPADSVGNVSALLTFAGGVGGSFNEIGGAFNTTVGVIVDVNVVVVEELLPIVADGRLVAINRGLAIRPRLSSSSPADPKAAYCMDWNRVGWKAEAELRFSELDGNWAVLRATGWLTPSRLTIGVSSGGKERDGEPSPNAAKHFGAIKSWMSCQI